MKNTRVGNQVNRIESNRIESILFVWQSLNTHYCGHGTLFLEQPCVCVGRMVDDLAILHDRAAPASIEIDRVIGALRDEQLRHVALVLAEIKFACFPLLTAIHFEAKQAPIGSRSDGGARRNETARWGNILACAYQPAEAGGELSHVQRSNKRGVERSNDPIALRRGAQSRLEAARAVCHAGRDAHAAITRPCAHVERGGIRRVAAIVSLSCDRRACALSARRSAFRSGGAKVRLRVLESAKKAVCADTEARFATDSLEHS